MEKSNEIDAGSVSGGHAVDGYEQLRQQALSGDADGWRLGLGVLSHRGVAAWLQVRATATATTVTASKPAATVPPTATGIDAELVGLLASMALAVAASR